MFPGTYVPRPMFPGTANVLNFACVCERERVRAHVFALGKGSPTCMCACMRACGRAIVHISELCRPLTYRQTNYQRKNYYNHNNLQRQKG